MRLLSINVSLPRVVTHTAETVTTGIFKEPVSGPISLRTRNLEGDGQADLKSHGGICKAVYAYPYEHYRYWSQELDRTDLAFGQFGENFTVEGMLEKDVSVGDVFRVGGALLEITQPRVPCFKLGIRMGGLDGFPKRFLKSGLVGFYMRVLQEGQVAAGTTIKRIKTDPEGMSIYDISHLMHFDKDNLSDANKALGIEALSPGWCRAFERRLIKANIPFDRRDYPLEKECCAGL